MVVNLGQSHARAGFDAADPGEEEVARGERGSQHRSLLLGEVLEMGAGAGGGMGWACGRAGRGRCARAERLVVARRRRRPGSVLVLWRHGGWGGEVGLVGAVARR